MSAKRQHGQERIRLRFAWLPRIVEKRSVWLRRYLAKERYTEQVRAVGSVLLRPIGYRWEEISVILLDKRIKRGSLL